MTDATEETDRAWRACVFPPGYRNPTPAARYHLVVIGAGPAGLVASIVAAGLGARVALVERHAMGGDCLNVGCVPSKTLLAAACAGLPFAEAMARVHAVRAGIASHDSVERYRAAGVDVFLGSASFVDAHTIRVGASQLRTRKSLIATGARAFVPPIPGLAALEVRTNESIFELRELPRRLAVLGGGPIGCELAQAFARLGSAVVLIEQRDRLLGNDEPQASALLAQALARDGVRLRLGVGVTAARRAASLRELVLSDGTRVEADEVLIATGRQRNVEGLDLERAAVRYDPQRGIAVNPRLQTSHPDIYAAGDVASRWQFTHVADAEARIIVRNALFLGRARADKLVIPWCTYTRPEVAHVGATRSMLEGSSQPYDALRVDFGMLDRARTDDGADGFAEVLVARGSDRVLGATIVGADAGEQIAAIAQLMGSRRGLGSLGSLVLPYPTRSEYLRRIADAWRRTRLTPAASRWLRWWLALTG